MQRTARAAALPDRERTFADAITEFAVAYPDQNESDYQALLDSERDGRIAVERGV